jgi:hypothetical protein
MTDALQLVVVGVNDAGISAGLRARELDPSVAVTLVVGDALPNFSIRNSRMPGVGTHTIPRPRART